MRCIAAIGCEHSEASLTEIADRSAFADCPRDTLEMVVVAASRIDSQMVQHGGGKIGRRDRSIGNVSAVGGCCAVDLAAANAAAAHQCREGVWPVVAAGFERHCVL